MNIKTNIKTPKFEFNNNKNITAYTSNIKNVSYDNNLITQNNNILDEIESMDINISPQKGHSSSSYSDQEDILINGICSKITNDIQNCFNDDDITYDGGLALYPIFSQIIEGKKICDIVDEEGCIKDLSNIITDNDKEEIMDKNNLSNQELTNIIYEMNKCLINESGESLKIVEYKDKMGTDIMNCKINDVVHKNSGFDAIVLEETNGNLMPIISGTNTNQTVDVFADLYPIINDDEQLSSFMKKADWLLNLNLYDDKFKSLMAIKVEYDDIYWSIIDVIAKIFNVKPQLAHGLGRIPDLIVVGDLILTGLLKAEYINEGNPNLSEVPEDVIATLVLEVININEDNPSLLSAYGTELGPTIGLTNKDMAMIENKGFLNYMKECYEKQRNEAQEFVKDTIQKAKDNNVKVDINGYSLGGGLALTSYANICSNDPSMEEYINSVTVYDPAIIHTERESNGDDLINYISESDKTKLFIVSGDLTATYNKSLKTDILDEQAFFIEPKETSTPTYKVDIKDSFIDNHDLKEETSKFLKKFNIKLTDDSFNYIAEKLEPLREKYLYRENDEDHNQNYNFILNQIIFNMDSVEDVFFGETHYMSSIDYSKDCMDGNFIQEAEKRNFVDKMGGDGSKQDPDKGVMYNTAQSVPSE